MSEAVINYCANHPDRETNLRCNNCGKYICSKCAIRTPTGYRCPECVRGQQKTFETAQASDYVIAFVVAAALSAVGAYLASRIGFFTILLAPAAGGVIAEAVRAATGKRRSPRLFQMTTVGVVVGGLPFVVRPLLFLLAGGSVGVLFAILWPLIYVSLATSTAYYRVSGIQIGRR
ncbi:MAG: B-box zinc finger protein [Anaerolineales bacterium]